MRFRILQTVIFYTIFVHCSLLYAQNEYNRTAVSGNVYFKNDSTPVYSAHILLKNTMFGTSSNADGQFILHIKSKNLLDTLVISFIGYKDFTIKVTEALKSPINVYLEENPLLLSSVLVTALTGKEIIKKAIENIDENYPKKNNFYDVYYKDIYQVGTKHSRFQEVSADVVSKGLFIDIHGKRDFQIFLKGKKTNFHSDTTFLESNGIYLLFGAHWARSFLFKKNLKKYKFTIEGITSYQGYEAYKLLVETTFKDAVAYLYITTKNYALVSVDYFYENPNKRMTNNKNEWSWLKYRFYLDFYENNSKWHIRSINDYRKTIESDNRIHESNRTLRVLNVQTGKNKSEKKNQIGYEADLYNYPMTYNPEFWKNYNAPPETEEEKRIKAELIEQGAVLLKSNED